MTQTLRNTHTEACTSSFSCLSFFGGSTILTPSVFSSSRLSRGLGFLLQWHTAHGPSHVSPIDVDHVTVWNEQSRSQRMTGYGGDMGENMFSPGPSLFNISCNSGFPLTGICTRGVSNTSGQTRQTQWEVGSRAKKRNKRSMCIGYSE